MECIKDRKRQNELTLKTRYEVVKEAEKNLRSNVRSLAENLIVVECKCTAF